MCVVYCKPGMLDRSGMEKRKDQKLWAKSEAEKLRLLVSYLRRLKRKAAGSRFRSCMLVLA